MGHRRGGDQRDRHVSPSIDMQAVSKGWVC